MQKMLENGQISDLTSKPPAKEKSQEIPELKGVRDLEHIEPRPNTFDPDKVVASPRDEREAIRDELRAKLQEDPGLDITRTPARPTSSFAPPAPAVASVKRSFKEDYNEIFKKTVYETPPREMPPRRAFDERAAAVKSSPTPSPAISAINPIFEAEPIELPRRGYPALRFLSGFFKVLAWFLVLATVGGFAYFAMVYANGNPMMLAAGLGITVFTGVMLLVLFYAIAESIQLRIETVEHLRSRT